MSRYTATVSWVNKGPDFLKNKYSRAHQWKFDGGCLINASAAPDIVPPPWSVTENVDPEEAFVASLASCHMLFFLSFAVKHGYLLESYTDNAEGKMEKNQDGKMAITEVSLHPETVFSGEKTPDHEGLAKLHHLAHEHCFIANSVTTKVAIVLNNSD